MMPAVAPVGRSDVGKLTLFNHLTRTRGALAADFPGLTHDHRYGHTEIEGRELICIDIGGIDGTKDGVETRMAEQSLLAIEEADVVPFIADARSGLMPADEAIVKYSRSREKPTFLVANKTDGLDPGQTVVDFYALGLGEIHPTVASHGRDVLSPLEHVLLPWVGGLTPQEEVNEDAGYRAQFEAEENSGGEKEDDFDPRGLSIELATVDHPNVGKSALTSRILGGERVAVYDMPDTTRDSIYVPMKRDGREYVLISTADVCKCGRITDAVEEFPVIKTLQAIEDVSVVMLVIDACEGISDQDLSLLGFTLSGGRSLVIVVNKWDSLSQEVKEQVKEILDFHLDFIDFARVHSISALHGSGVGNLFESAREVYDSSTRRIRTSMLTRIMTMAVEDHQPPLVRGRRVKLRYAHAGGYNPLIVMIRGNQVKDLPDSHRRHLMDYFCKSLDVMGSPIRIQLKGGENPYTNKHNILTPTRMRKHKRLIKHIRKNKQSPIWFPFPHGERS